LAAVHARGVWWGEVWEAGRRGQDARVEFWVRTSPSIVSISSLKRRLTTWAADGSIAGAKPAKCALRSDIGCSGMDVCHVATLDPPPCEVSKGKPEGHEPDVSHKHSLHSPSVPVKQSVDSTGTIPTHRYSHREHHLGMQSSTVW
jgi:hypothetical protein